MTRSIVLRATQRANSRTIALTVAIEIDGHTIAIPNAHASTSNRAGVPIDVDTARKLLASLTSEIRSLTVDAPLWADR
jgi:hypothetical protein